MSDEELEPFVDAFEHAERNAAEEAYLKIRADNSPNGYAVTGHSGHGQIARWSLATYLGRAGVARLRDRSLHFD